MKRSRRLVVTALVVLTPFILNGAWAASPALRTRHVIFVMTDGLRWEEVFRGADADIMDAEHGGVADVPALKQAFWRDALEERRQVLMPFLWTTVARHGQIYGNRDGGSDALVTNGKNFSYPGYSETLCGFADPRIDSNGEFFNPNVTVLEWLSRRPGYQGRVAAFGAWYLFPWIINAPRAGFTINAGWEPLDSMKPTPALSLLNRLKRESPRIWDDEPVDALTFHTALEYMKSKKPAVLYLSLGETDVWGHARDYGNYLRAAQRADAYLRELWETAQSMREYRDSTTLIFSPDHGRGSGAQHWTDHGAETNGSNFIWMAFLGPDTAALGLRSRIAAVRQDQIAATLAALLGQDYQAGVPRAGALIGDVLVHTPRK